jgi:hypothetical protein
MQAIVTDFRGIPSTPGFQWAAENSRGSLEKIPLVRLGNADHYCPGHLHKRQHLHHGSVGEPSAPGPRAAETS